MPDTFTHIAIPILLRKIFKQPLILPLVLIGTVLPDYFREFFSFSLPFKYYPAVLTFHSFLGIMLTSLFLASFFNVIIRKQIFISLITGQFIHLFIDSLQFYLCGNSLFLFLPVWKSFQIGLISETHWLFIFLFTVILLTIFFGFSLVKRYQSKN